MSELLTFHISSLNRNKFMQCATGLFGGDANSGLRSYPVDDDQYRSSANYVSAVSAEGGTCQRAALAAWYLASQGTINGPSSLGWTISRGLWTIVQRPNQCITLIEDGLVVLGTPGLASTQTECQLENLFDPTGPFPKLNRPFTLRTRSPRQITYGPILAADDGRTVVVQTDVASFIPPVPGQDLVYLGARSSHPTRTAAWHPPEVANQFVFGVDSVVPLPADSDPAALSICATALPVDGPQQWCVCGANTVTGICHLRTTDHPTALLTGLEYTWPFPPDQVGMVCLLIPFGIAPEQPHGSPKPPPNGVHIVRAMLLNRPMVTEGTVGDVTLADGDRVACCVTAPFIHTDIWQWNATTVSFTLVTVIPRPTHPLVLVVEAVGALATAAWWDGQSYTVVAASHSTSTCGAMQTTTDALVPPDPQAIATALVAAQTEADAAQIDLQVILDAVARATLANNPALLPPPMAQTMAEQRVTKATDALQAAEAAATATPSANPLPNHVLIVMYRGEEFDRVQPRSVLSSLYVPPVGWAWTYPVTDGTDLFQAAGLTDGLIGSVCVDSRHQKFFFMRIFIGR